MPVTHDHDGFAVVASRALAAASSLFEDLRVAVEGARSDTRLVELSHTIWQGHAAGVLDDDGAQALSELIHARRKALRGPQKALSRHLGRPSIFPARRPQRSPDRLRSVERRRTLAASGPLPPALASKFTTGEVATLKIVADEVRQQGTCSLCTDAIAARAGVSNTTARNAIRTARFLGLLTVEERRRHGQRNDTNVIRVENPAWKAWIAKGGAPKAIGVKNLRPTVKEVQKRGFRKLSQNQPSRLIRDPERSSSQGS